MSTMTSGLPKKGPRDTRTFWSLKLAPRTAEGLPLTTVVCGYVKGRAGPTWYAAAPTFATAGVRIVGMDASRQFGHLVHHTPDEFGGFTYRMMFYNESDKPTAISCSVLGGERLPDSMHASIVDETNGTIRRADETLSVQVPAKSRAYRVLAVGDKYYAAKLLRNVAPFTRFALYPNPFRGALTVSFMMPESVKRVVCRLFDTQGRLVWQHAQPVRGGRANRVVWDGRTPRGRPVAAGSYVLRLSAYGFDGTHVASLEQQLIHLR
jgi:hypothetical protein